MPAFVASVTFYEVALNVAGDEADCILLKTSQIEHDPTTATSTKQYMGGYFPSATMVQKPDGTLVIAKQRSSKVTLTVGSTLDAQVVWLKAHQGALVFYRDGRGEKFTGTYSDPTFAPQRGLPYWDVSFSVQETTYSDLL